MTRWLKSLVFQNLHNFYTNHSRNFYIRYHPRKFTPQIVHHCKKLNNKPFNKKRTLSEEKAKMAEKITHLMGAIPNENCKYPSVRLLMCFDQHAMLGSERLYYKYLFRHHGFEMYKIKSGMVDYAFRRQHQYLRFLQPLFYCDSILIGSKINDERDPLPMFIEVMKIINGEQPRIFFAKHRVPIKNRFILTGGRMDYTLYTAKNLQDLMKLPEKESVVEKIYGTQMNVLIQTHSNFGYQLRALSHAIDSLSKNKQ